MLKQRLTVVATFTCIVVVCGVSHAPAQEAAEAADTTRAAAEGDPFVGTYGRGLIEGDAVTITRDGNVYQIDKQGYQDFTFKQRQPDILEDDQQTLGTITRGELTFADAPDQPITVLKVNFCYEHFLLYKKSGTNSLAAYHKALPRTFNFSKNIAAEQAAARHAPSAIRFAEDEAGDMLDRADLATDDVRADVAGEQDTEGPKVPLLTKIDRVPDLDETNIAPDPTAQAAQKPMILSLKKDGTMHVGKTAMTPAALAQHLRLTAPERVIIRADKQITYADVMHVFNACVKAGVQDVSFATAR